MFPKVGWAEGRKWAGYRSVGGSGTLHLGGIARAAGGRSYSVPTLVAQRLYGDTVQATVIISLCFSGDVEKPCFLKWWQLVQMTIVIVKQFGPRQTHCRQD